MPTNTCRYCGETFTHNDATVDICRTCWYSGRRFEEQYAALLKELAQVNANVGVDHTGGGCFCIRVALGSSTDKNGWFNTYAYLTDSEAMELPEGDAMGPEQRWLVGIYDERLDDKGREVNVEYRDDLTLPQALEYLFAWDIVFLIRDDDSKALSSVKSFAALQEHVDANVMLESAFEAFNGDFEALNRITAIVDQKLQEVEL